MVSGYRYSTPSEALIAPIIASTIAVSPITTASGPPITINISGTQRRTYNRYERWKFRVSFACAATMSGSFFFTSQTMNGSTKPTPISADTWHRIMSALSLVARQAGEVAEESIVMGSFQRYLSIALGGC